MTEFLLWCLPALVYVFVQARRPDGSMRGALKRLGVAWGSPRAWLWALGILAVTLGLSWGASLLIPASVWTQPGVTVGVATSAAAVLAVILRAVGEEVFFRGLLGGVLMRRLGAVWGNLAQAAIFLLPHLALLAVDARVWPLLPAQFLTALLLGWLRHRAGSFVPGAAVHAAVNLTAGLLWGGAS